MTDQTIDLDDIEAEGPGGTQLTHPIAMEGRDITRDLEQQIREHPVRSLAIALIGGFLIAKLFD